MPRIQQNDLRLTPTEVFGHVIESVKDSTMIVQCAFWLSGRPGCEEAVNQVIRRNLLNSQAVIGWVEFFGNYVDHVDARAECGVNFIIYEDRSWSDLFKICFYAVDGPGWIERHKYCP